MYSELAKRDPVIVRVGNYQFDWDKLGRDGIAACPDLVEDIRGFMNAYDCYFWQISTTFNKPKRRRRTWQYE